MIAHQTLLPRNEKQPKKKQVRIEEEKQQEKTQEKKRKVITRALKNIISKQNKKNKIK